MIRKHLNSSRGRAGGSRAPRAHLAALGASAVGIVCAALAAPALAQQPSATARQEVAELAEQTPGKIEHCTNPVRSRNFLMIFACGNEMFETSFNAVDGVG